MAEFQAPETFLAAIRWLINGLVFILPPIVIEQVLTGNIALAICLFVAFVVDFAAAVKWGFLERSFRKFGNMDNAHIVLLLSICGTWMFLTIGLSSAAWLLWSRKSISPTYVAKENSQESGPIQWSGGFSIEGDLTSKIFSLRFSGANISKEKALQIKEANIISSIDGTLLPLEIVASDASGGIKIVSIDKIQLVPPGARIELVAKFGEQDKRIQGNVVGLDPKSFLDKWRQFSFNVVDDVRSYRHEFNESHMMTFFQGRVGPRVAIKP